MSANLETLGSGGLLEKTITTGTAPAPAATPGTVTVAEGLAEALRTLGAVHAFGVCGGAQALLWASLSKHLEVLHFRHESGAAFAAIEAHFVSNRPVVVFTTTGPGITNALTGLIAARTEGAKIVLLSAYGSAPQRGYPRNLARTPASGTWAHQGPLRTASPGR